MERSKDDVLFDLKDFRCLSTGAASTIQIAGECERYWSVRHSQTFCNTFADLL